MGNHPKGPDKVMADIMEGLISVMLNPDDHSPNSKTLGMSYFNVVSALTSQLFESGLINPIELIGILDTSKALVMHKYYELMTIDKMTNGK